MELKALLKLLMCLELNINQSQFQFKLLPSFRLAFFEKEYEKMFQKYFIEIMQLVKLILIEAAPLQYADYS